MDAPRPVDSLSLHATLFLIAIDPQSGRMVKRRRLRFRRALARARGRRGPAWRACVSELRAAGLIERSPVPFRYPIVPGSGASIPFARLSRSEPGRRPGA